MRRRIRTSDRSRLRLRDLLGVGSIGLRGRPVRTLLTAVGIAIGIASLLAIFGITDAGNRSAQEEIDALGADLLLIQPGQGVTEAATLSPHAPGMLDTHIPAIEYTAAVYAPGDANARRSGFIPEAQTGGISVIAIGPDDTDLMEPLNATLAFGRFHDPASVQVPTVVLGSLAAQRLGVSTLAARPAVDISGTRFDVIGVLNELSEFNTDFNRNAIIGLPVAQELFGAEDNPAAIYLQVPPAFIDQVRAVVPRQADPDNEAAVVSRPTEALQAKEVIEDTFKNLVLGLGGIAALVGAIGVANVMVISVLERRGEIGLRRSLGATKGHIALQFLVESVLLTVLGGLLGVGLGIAVTVAWTRVQGWSLLIPWDVAVAALAGAAAVGALAGLYPAWRAARMDPADAVRPAA